MKIAEQFNDDGFAILRGVFSIAEIGAMERELARCIRDVVPDLKPGDVFYEDAPGKPIKSIFRLEQRSEFFRQLLEEERLLTLMRDIFAGADVRRVGVGFFGKAARSGSVTPPHQDNAFQNLAPPEELVATIAIDESTPANGALTVQRGTHKLGTLPHRPSGVMGFSQTLIEPVDTRQYPEVQLCLKPGDVCLHHTNTIHRSDGNQTGKSRRQLALQYRSAQAQRDPAAWERYQEEVRKLHAAHGLSPSR